jgi:hypothetical protein
MIGTPNRREVLALGVGLSLSGLALGQTQPNVREIGDPGANVQDRGKYEAFPKVPNDDFWVLDFRFKDPRLILADVPARGKKVCWYLWYQVINKTNKPRTFFPVFELVTRDRNTRHRDQFLPTVQEAIRESEDKNNYYKIKNSWSISNDPIPPSLEKDAVMRAVPGVAIWDDVDPESNYYDIFIAGLSNGYSITDPIPPDTRQVIRRKTLQLAFRRIGDSIDMKSSEIQFQQPATWVYRGTTLDVPGLGKKAVPPPKP